MLAPQVIEDCFLKECPVGSERCAVLVTPRSETTIGCFFRQGVASKQVTELFDKGNVVTHRMYLSSGGMSSSW